jgi:hypothetical protein
MSLNRSVEMQFLGTVASNDVKARNNNYRGCFRELSLRIGTNKARSEAPGLFASIPHTDVI